MLLVTIYRVGSTDTPRGNTEILPGDILMVSKSARKGSADIPFNEILIHSAHPWEGERIVALNLLGRAGHFD